MTETVKDIYFEFSILTELVLKGSLSVEYKMRVFSWWLSFDYIKKIKNEINK